MFLQVRWMYENKGAKSEFSEVISKFITGKNIKMYDLIDYCKIDRSTLYQIIKGKRNPPLQCCPSSDVGFYAADCF